VFLLFLTLSEKNGMYVVNSDSEDSDYFQEGGDTYLKRITEKGRTLALYMQLKLITYDLLRIMVRVDISK